MLFMDLSICGVIAQAFALYTLTRYYISMPLIAYTVTRYVHSRFFETNNEMERIEGSFETTHRMKTLQNRREDLQHLMASALWQIGEDMMFKQFICN